ncbi:MULTISPECIES: hypothetical protein, partial [unclassified Vibrio]|uniref:hypothetical protein n=1 Tax=unclassified Vibrio TaxID=2614977 RepID=UPI001C3CF954
YTASYRAFLRHKRFSLSLYIKQKYSSALSDNLKYVHFIENKAQTFINNPVGKLPKSIFVNL